MLVANLTYTIKNNIVRTSIERPEQEQKRGLVQRKLPPGMGRILAFKTWDFIQSLANETGLVLEHEVNMQPKGISDDKWVEIFGTELRRRGYKNKFGSERTWSRSYTP